MTVVGIDFSLTGTGVCAITDGEAECITIGTKPYAEWWRHPERVSAIAQGMHLFVTEKPAWVIESPSFMSKGRGHDMVLSGWWLLVDEMIRNYGWEPPLRVAPAQLKKFATGKGQKVDKADVAAQLARRFPDVNARGNNEWDAVGLAAIGAAAYGEPFNGTLLKYQQEIVDAVRAGRKEAL